MDLNVFSRQVRKNCDITDARYAGLYSVCGLAMRLRDLYKWEHDIPFWQEGDADRVLDWIGTKEATWEAVMSEEFAPLQINGSRFDPFDSRGINAALNPHGFYYGAGYAHSLKPTFFVAQIVETTLAAGHTVWHLGREHARDLLTLPAFSQDGQIVLRNEAGRMFLWDQIMYINKAGRRPLALAMQACGVPDAEPETLRSHIDKVLDAQQMVYLWHEVGELEEQIFDRHQWRKILADHPHTVVELFARALKDILADTGARGALSVILAHRNAAALGLYMAFGKGLFPVMCSELVGAFDRFISNSEWAVLESAAREIRRKATAYTHQVLDIYHGGRKRKNKAWTRRTIEALMHEQGLLSK